MQQDRESKYISVLFSAQLREMNMMASDHSHFRSWVCERELQLVSYLATLQSSHIGPFLGNVRSATLQYRRNRLRLELDLSQQSELLLQ